MSLPTWKISNFSQLVPSVRSPSKGSWDSSKIQQTISHISASAPGKWAKLLYSAQLQIHEQGLVRFHAWSNLIFLNSLSFGIHHLLVKANNDCKEKFSRVIQLSKHTLQWYPGLGWWIKISIILCLRFEFLILTLAWRWTNTLLYLIIWSNIRVQK